MPQCILDIANTVDWNHISPILYIEMATGLNILVSKERLPKIDPKNQPAKPVSSPVPDVAPDVPQPVLDVFNSVNWTKVSPNAQRDMANRLSAFLNGPLKHMGFHVPRRSWNNVVPV